MSKNQIKVLFIDDNVNLLETTEAALELEGFAVCTAPDGKTGMGKIKSEKPDLLLIDVNLPDINGFDICKDVKRSAQTMNIPVIMVTGDHTVDIEKGFSVGADDCIMKPIDIALLAMRIGKLVGRKDKVLLVEDDRQICDIIMRVLEKHGCEIEVLTEGSKFLETAKRFVPDIALLDISLGTPPDGIELCRQLKNEPATKNIPVLMLTANECTKSIDTCFSMGVEDYLFKPFTIPDLLGKIKKHLARNRKPS